MGLWLKCPGCQAQNPLPIKVCPHCGQALDKLPAAQRVYVMGPAPALPQVADPSTAKPPMPAVASQPIKPPSEAGATPKPAKKPKKARKKKG
jgi:hypothetical protein